MSRTLFAVLLLAVATTAVADEPPVETKRVSDDVLRLQLKREQDPDFLEREASAEIMAVYARLLALRAAEASDGEWDAFATEEGPKLREIANRLEDVATAKRPGLQRMVWASRDYLLPMVEGRGDRVGARLGPTKADVKFMEQMSSLVHFHKKLADERREQLEKSGEAEEK